MKDFDSAASKIGAILSIYIGVIFGIKLRLDKLKELQVKYTETNYIQSSELQFQIQETENILYNLISKGT